MKFTRFSKITLLLTTILLLLAACSSGSAPQTTEAPDFSLDNALGGKISLKEFVGIQPVLLYFHMAVG